MKLSIHLKWTLAPTSANFCDSRNKKYYDPPVHRIEPVEQEMVSNWKCERQVNQNQFFRN